MTGDSEKILRLYREMTGEEVEEDLSDVWPVQLGSATEHLNLDWMEMKGTKLSRRGEVAVHRTYDWAACTLDASIDELSCPVEAKHTSCPCPPEGTHLRYHPHIHL